ncbi:hypothetical protein PsAD2_04091 [Pseudovibrio axinellae]|uniref:Uncharacterized protein n=1 Tax=Pseudovibrio axinellae TaxID=989403 RepID=A0A165U0X4_9HYPH|nr:hypothetical protein PsAD2_04091 [Pseudovibrio axinellae]
MLTLSCSVGGAIAVKVCGLRDLQSVTTRGLGRRGDGVAMLIFRR